jgi:SAM-dependent methyltransferase
MTTTHEDQHHRQHAEFDWAAQTERLELGEELHRAVFEQAAAWLRELRGSGSTERILDVGSGAGIVSEVLARAFPGAEVVAVDGTAALLEVVMERARRMDIAARVTTVQANLPEDAARLPEADLIWASDVVHHLGDQQAAIDLLRQSLRPGGMLALCEGGLPARYLPTDIGFGRPGLLARVDAVTADRFAAMRAALPQARLVADDWPGMLRQSGFEAVFSRTFLVDMSSPLSEQARKALTSNLAGQRDWIAEFLDASDVKAIARLLDTDDPGGLTRRDDVFFLTARTVHTGRG